LQGQHYTASFLQVLNSFPKVHEEIDHLKVNTRVQETLLKMEHHTFNTSPSLVNTTRTFRRL
jgi:hypothetical protein